MKQIKILMILFCCLSAFFSCGQCLKNDKNEKYATQEVKEAINNKNYKPF